LGHFLDHDLHELLLCGCGSCGGFDLSLLRSSKQFYSGVSLYKALSDNGVKTLHQSLSGCHMAG
jgi:hypothetical protein